MNHEEDYIISLIVIMRQLSVILKIILAILLLITLFVWLMAHGSGHDIPIETDLKLGITGIVLFALLILAIYHGRKNKD